MQSFSDLIKPITKDTDQICEVHNLHKRKIIGKEDYLECPECAREKHDQRITELARKWTDESIRARTQSFLHKDSIFLDDTLKDAEFDNYKTDDAETTRNKQHALEIAREYFKDANYNTLFTGRAGTGKSHLAMSMLKAVNEHSRPYKKCLFVSVDELMRRIKASFSDGGWYTEERMIRLLTDVDLLVLDDLGAETGSIHSTKSATDFTTKVLYAVVNGRMNKPTITTTNLNSKELIAMYDSKLISRLLKGTKGHTVIFKETTDKRMDFDF